MSVPIELLALVSLLNHGPNKDNSNFSQSSLTISQFILSNVHNVYHNATNPEYRRRDRQLEKPIQIYSSLKLYSTIRSRNLIDQMFRLCLSYVWHMFIMWPSFGTYKESVKDNCHLNATSSTSSMHYHGTSITISFLHQLLRQTNLVQKRYRYFLHPMLRHTHLFP